MAVSSREQIRERMLEAISEYSEDRWAAGWMNGIEREVRAIGGGWTLMAAACGGWPIGYRGEEGWDELTEGEINEISLLLHEWRRK